MLALRSLAMQLQSGRDRHETGLRAFDRHSLGQRVSLLDEVTAALLRDDVPIPTHTSANESAVFAVFRHLQSMVESEIDSQYEEPVVPNTVRSFVRAACRSVGVDSLGLDETDPESWRFCVESLADRVLWGRDFDDEDLIVDGAPAGIEPEGVLLSWVHCPLTTPESRPVKGDRSIA